MALHIQMSEEAEAALRRTALRNKLSSIAACLAFILFGGGIMFFTVILIAIEPEAEFISYVQPADDAPPRPTPTTPQLSAKQSSPSNTVAPSVIVANAAAPVAMAQVDIPMDDSADDGMSLDIGMGLDGGLGDGLGDGGSGLGSSQGGGSALEGTFYDLKLTRAKAPTGIKLVNNALDGPSKNQVHKILHDFTKTWSQQALSKYYSSPTKLYASNFYLPQCSAAYAPHAYQCTDVCKPSAWLAVYRGKVKAPKSGKFRFVGTGDDVLCVRFKGKMVLEAGWCIPSLYDDKAPGKCGTIGAINGPSGKQFWDDIKSGKDKIHKGYEQITFPETADWNKNLGGLSAGTVFEVKEGETCPIEIMVSEVPGGAFGFVLFIQDMSSTNKKDIALFRTNFSLPDKAELQKLLKEAKGQWGNGEMQAPAYNPDSPIWVAVP